MKFAILRHRKNLQTTD